MPCQIHAASSHSHPKTHEQADQQAADDAEAQAAARADTDTASLVEHSDELLDEIDSVLEENAAEFVLAFVNKGGE